MKIRKRRNFYAFTLLYIVDSDLSLNRAPRINK